MLKSIFATTTGRPLDSNDQNQVADQRFSLKQWFVGGCSVSRAQKTWLWSLLFKVFLRQTANRGLKFADDFKNTMLNVPTFEVKTAAYSGDG